MFPVLLHLGPLTLHTYGLLVALGLLLGLRVLLNAYRLQNDYQAALEDALQQIVLSALFCALVSARLFYVIVFWPQFAQQPLDILKVWQGGLIFYGGLLGGFLALWFFNARLKKFSFLRLLDWSAPALALGHALGRIGCFSAGCCYGKETTCSWGVVFTAAESLTPRYVFLHPTQLYEATFLLVLAKWLLHRTKQAVTVPLPSGQIFSEYVIFYALGRLIVEFFRADEAWFLGLSAGQLAAGLSLFAGLTYYWTLKKKMHQI